MRSARKKTRTKSRTKSRSKRTKKTTRTRQSAPESLPTVPVDELEQERSWVFYGRTGTGKTTLLGTFPKPILLLDINDRGTGSIKGYGDEIQVLSCHDWQDFEDAYWYLVAHPEEYATFGIDTITELQELAIKKHLREVGKDTDRAGDWGTMSRGDWGDVAAFMKRWITDIRNLSDKSGIEVVFNAQDRIFGNEDEDYDESEELNPEVGARLSPSVRAHLNSMCSNIGNTYVRRRQKVVKLRGGKRKKKTVNEYCLRIGPSPVYDTKMRKPKEIELPDFLIDPSYEELRALIEGKE